MTEKERHEESIAKRTESNEAFLSEEGKENFEKFLLIKECGDKLREAGIAHWIMAEGDISLGGRYIQSNYVPTLFDSEGALSPDGQDLIKAHLGGLVANVFDVFAIALKQNNLSEDFPNILSEMLKVHKFYLDKVQPTE